MSAFFMAVQCGIYDQYIFKLNKAFSCPAYQLSYQTSSALQNQV